MNTEAVGSRPTGHPLGKREYMDEMMDDKIFQEVSMNTKSILLKVLAERKRQDGGWGADRTHNVSTWLMILMEEVGEVCEAFLDGRITDGRQELIQACAVLVAWLESSYIDKDSNHVKFD